ncbi:hypothetical protein ACFCYN_22830 [Gottfriedia sp. NPDC056225]|uniref:hypothetical protein n=1 Tax=Gottfriedia sp. NPDC056225 TaxID=3345751 RepID=UPI0035D720FA
MSIQKCLGCGHLFKWIVIESTIVGWTIKPLVCKHCTTKHVIKNKTRILVRIQNWY